MTCTCMQTPAPPPIIDVTPEERQTRSACTCRRERERRETSSHKSENKRDRILSVLLLLLCLHNARGAGREQRRPAAGLRLGHRHLDAARLALRSAWARERVGSGARTAARAARRVRAPTGQSCQCDSSTLMGRKRVPLKYGSGFSPRMVREKRVGMISHLTSWLTRPLGSGTLT